MAKGQGWGPSVALHDGAEVVSGDFWISQESVNLWDGRKLFFCPSSLCPSYRWVAECRGSVCLDRDGMLAEVLSRALSAGALPRHHGVPPVGGVGQGEPLRVFEESTSHLLRLCKLPSLAYSLQRMMFLGRSDPHWGRSDPHWAAKGCSRVPSSPECL